MPGPVLPIPLTTGCEAARLRFDGFELVHRVPLFKGGADDDTNLQVLCTTPCHEEKTRADLGQAIKRSVGENGWPV